MDHVEALELGLRVMYLAPVDGGFCVAVAEHAEVEEGEGDRFGEEDFAYCCWDFGEGVADAADYDVLEEGGVADEGGTLVFWCQVSFPDQLDRHDGDWDDVSFGL